MIKVDVDLKPKEEVKQNVEEIDFEKMLTESFIDPGEELQRPPVAISIGETQYKGVMYPIQFGSYGDFSAIVGHSKSRKTFAKSGLGASYIGGNANIYFPSMKGHDNAGKYFIDFDTEQSKWHVQRVTRRICEMVGAASKFHVSFSLRAYGPKQRLAFIERIITNSQYTGKIGMICIDGIADLVNDFNSIEEAKDVENKVLNWTAEHKFHLIAIIHRNFGTSKPVGHLGSMILKKAETVAFVETQDGITTVKCEYSRNQPFEDLHFEVNKDWLPHELDAELKMKLKTKKDKPKPDF